MTLPPAGAVSLCGTEHQTLEPRERDYLNAIALLCATQSLLIVSAHYVDIKYHHLNSIHLNIINQCIEEIFVKTFDHDSQSIWNLASLCINVT